MECMGMVVFAGDNLVDKKKKKIYIYNRKKACLHSTYIGEWYEKEQHITGDAPNADHFLKLTNLSISFHIKRSVKSGYAVFICLFVVCSLFQGSRVERVRDAVSPT